MQRIFLTCLILTLQSQNLFAKSTYVLMGAGGEPKDSPTTQFDMSLRNMSDYYQGSKNRYDAYIAVNGGHTETTRLVNERFAGANIESNGFLDQTYNSILENIKNKLNNNEYSSSDKILINIDTHGGEPVANVPGHTISTSAAAMSSMNTSGATSVNTYKLKEIVDLANSKGIKIAIIDHSCHSGATMDLQNENTCVITASTANQYALSDFSNNFANFMRSGKSLEDVFLDTRNASMATPFPLINSPVGLKVQEELSAVLPFLKYHGNYRNMELDKIDRYLKDNSNAEKLCRRENQFNDLFKWFDDVEKAATRQEGFWIFKREVKDIDFTKIRKKLTEYKAIQDSYFNRLREINYNNEKLNETVEIQEGDVTNKFKMKEILTADWDASIRFAENDSRLSQSGGVRDYYAKYIRIYTRAKELKNQYLHSEEYLKEKQIFNDLARDQNLTLGKIEELSQEVKEVYKARYKQLSQMDEYKTKKNACRDFTLE